MLSSKDTPTTINTTHQSWNPLFCFDAASETVGAGGGKFFDASSKTVGPGGGKGESAGLLKDCSLREAGEGGM